MGFAELSGCENIGHCVEHSDSLAVVVKQFLHMFEAAGALILADSVSLTGGMRRQMQTLRETPKLRSPPEILVDGGRGAMASVIKAALKNPNTARLSLHTGQQIAGEVDAAGFTGFLLPDGNERALQSGGQARRRCEGR